MASVVVRMINGQVSKKPYIFLMDSGATGCWLKQGSLPPGACPKVGEARSSNTLAGKLSSNLTATLSGVTLPEFFRKRVVDKMDAGVFNNPSCRYDGLIGKTSWRRS